MSTTPLTILDQERRTFEQHKYELLGRHPAGFALVHGQSILGTYDTANDAISEGYRQLGNVPFLVQQIVEYERPLSFVSGHIAC